MFKWRDASAVSKCSCADMLTMIAHSASHSCGHDQAENQGCHISVGRKTLPLVPLVPLVLTWHCPCRLLSLGPRIARACCVRCTHDPHTHAPGPNLDADSQEVASAVQCKGASVIFHVHVVSVTCCLRSLRLLLLRAPVGPSRAGTTARKHDAYQLDDARV